MREIQIQCIIFRRLNNHFEFLLLKRIPEKGGFWQPPSGGLEKDDASKLEAGFREVMEETGIPKDKIIGVIEDVHSFVMDKHYLTGDPIQPITEYVFAFEVKIDVIVRMDVNICPEHEEYSWVSYDDALSMLKWENNKDAFRKLKKILFHESAKA